MATRMLSRASCSVAPCDQQPGSAGQDTAKPSSDGYSATRYRMTPRTLHSGLAFLQVEQQRMLIPPPPACTHDSFIDQLGDGLELRVDSPLLIDGLSPVHRVRFVPLRPGGLHITEPASVGCCHPIWLTFR